MKTLDMKLEKVNQNWPIKPTKVSQIKLLYAK